MSAETSLLSTVNSQLPDGYKKTDVGIIPEDWDVERLGNSLLANPDYGINAAAVAYSDNLPVYIRITDITEDGKFSPDKRCSVKHLNSDNYFLEDGNIVFARTGASTGKTYLYDSNDGNLVFAGFLIRVKINKNKLVPKFLKFYTETVNYWNWVRIMSMRSGQPGINGIEYASLPIPLPPLPEQQAIAEVLTDVDALITSSNQLITKKRNIKQSAMQILLTGKKRLVAERKAGHKQTEFGIIPEDWQVKQLGQLFEITSSKRVFQSEWKSEGVPFYRARELAVLGERGSVDNELFISREMYEIFKRLYGVPETNDMLVTGVGTLGKTYVVENNREFYFKDGNIIWFKINGKINSHYLRQLYLTPLIKKQLEDASAGTTVGTYTITGANKTKIPMPPLHEQKAIAQTLSDMDAEIEVLEKKREKYKAIKQGMMQELLTGKMRLVGKL